MRHVRMPLGDDTIEYDVEGETGFGPDQVLLDGDDDLTKDTAFAAAGYLVTSFLPDAAWNALSEGIRLLLAQMLSAYVPLDESSFRLEDYRIRFWKSLVVKCNWKAALEAFEEVYHIMRTHPQVLRGMDDVGSTYATLGPHSYMLNETGVANPRFKGRVKEQDVLKITLAGLLDFGLASENERAMLEEMGHTVIGAASAKEALGKMRANDTISLVISDHAMPQMTGAELAELIRNEWPQTAIVLVSGYAELPNGASTTVARLNKPFSIAELARVIEDQRH